MESPHQLINMCKISEVKVKDLPKINELENQLNLNKTKLNFFNKTLSNENFKFIKLVLENNSWWEEKPDLVEKELFDWCNGEYFNQSYDPYGLESVTDNDYDENGNWRHE